MKTAKPRWNADSARRLFQSTTLGMLARSQELGLKVKGLTRKTLKGTDVGYSKLEKQRKHDLAVARKNRRSTEE